MTVKVNMANGGATGVDFVNDAGTTLAQVRGYDDGSSNGHVEIYTTSAGVASEKVRVDKDGNVGIGTSSPAANSLSIARGSATNASVEIAGNGNTPSTTSFSLIQAGDNTAYIYNRANGPILFGTNNLERARIDTSGNLLVGTTSGGSYKTQIESTTGNALLLKTSAGVTQDCWQTQTSGNNVFIQFYTETAATLRGSITYNRGGGLTAYNTTSDYRAKTVTGPVENALVKVASLKPSTGRMNGAEYEIDFFVAHELQEVVPSAVTGKKDAVNEDGSPNYQMVDKSAIIPLLTAAIQEQQALITQQAATLVNQQLQIDALTERLTALENK